MTRSQLIKAVALKYPEISQQEIDLIVSSIFEGMASSLCQGERVKLRGFGSMEQRSRRARMARNPKTGAKVEIDCRRTVVFYPGRELSAELKNQSVEGEAETETMIAAGREG